MFQKDGRNTANAGGFANPVCRFIAKCLILTGVVSFYGCSAANHCSLSRNREVTQAFENFQIFADHRYYYLNAENKPYAVVALQENYAISDHMWRELDLNAEKFKKVIGLVKNFQVYSNFQSYGSDILDHRQNRLGYWYSSLRSVTIKVDHASRKISINTEKPWLQDDEERFIEGAGSGRTRN
jgi:hypothetical protein